MSDEFIIGIIFNEFKSYTFPLFPLLLFILRDIINNGISVNVYWLPGYINVLAYDSEHEA